MGNSGIIVVAIIFVLILVVTMESVILGSSEALRLIVIFGPIVIAVYLWIREI